MAMLARSVARPAINAGVSMQLARASALPLSAQAGFHSSTAQESTLRELEHRIKSVKNIEKITKVRLGRNDSIQGRRMS
jgi:F-type H+-transporting ATPase subunit gamma